MWRRPSPQGKQGCAKAIAHTARSHNRQADAVRLIAVSKTWGAEVLAEAVRAGQKDFGENRLSELREKFSLSDGSLTKLLTATERKRSGCPFCWLFAKQKGACRGAAL